MFCNGVVVQLFSRQPKRPLVLHGLLQLQQVLALREPAVLQKVHPSDVSNDALRERRVGEFQRSQLFGVLSLREDIVQHFGQRQGAFAGFDRGDGRHGRVRLGWIEMLMRKCKN